MDTHSIVTCECGAQVRLPVDRVGRTFRCPSCKKLLTPAAPAPDTRVVATTTFGAGQTRTLCPICQTPIGSDAQVVKCSACDQVHHGECWAEVGGCGTYGCTQAPEVVKTEQRARTTAWGDKKDCPMCGETIRSTALRCRHCGTKFDTVDPMTREDLLRRRALEREQKILKTSTVILFVLSLIGCPAPLVGLISSAYLMPKGEELMRCGPLYFILAWASIIVSGCYTVVFAVFLISHYMLEGMG